MLTQLQQQQQANLPPGIRLNESTFMDNGDNEELDQEEEYEEMNSIDENLNLTNGDFDEEQLEDENEYQDEDIQQSADYDETQRNQEINANGSFDDEPLEDDYIDEDQQEHHNQEEQEYQQDEIDNNYQESAYNTAASFVSSLNSNQTTPKSNNRRKNNQQVRKPHMNYLPIKNENHFSDNIHQDSVFKTEDYEDLEASDSLQIEMTNPQTDEELDDENSLSHEEFGQSNEIISNMT